MLGGSHKSTETWIVPVDSFGCDCHSLLSKLKVHKHIDETTNMPRLEALGGRWDNSANILDAEAQKPINYVRIKR